MDIIHTIFNTYVAVPALSEVEERTAIAEALSGSESATELLLRAYAPALKGAVSRAPYSADKEDLISAALMGFMEALKAFEPDKHHRLAAVIKNKVTQEVANVGKDASGFTIPPRTLSRWFSILKKSGGNIFLASSLAAEYSMTTATFLEIYSALRNVGSVDEHLETGDIDGAWQTVGGRGDIRTIDPLDEDDAALVELVFEKRGDEADLTDRELQVVHTAYGFNDYSDQTKSDAEIAQMLHLTRPTAQRTRASALSKSRSRLGIAA